MGILNSQNQVAQPGDYMANSMSIAPTLGQTISDDFKSGFLAPIAGAGDLRDQFAPPPPDAGNNLQHLVEAINNQDDIQGQSDIQKAAGFVSNAAGFMLNPINYLSGDAGGVAVKSALDMGEKLLPEAAMTALSKPVTSIADKPITSSAIASTTLIGTGAGIGAGIPQSLSSSFDESKQQINWSGVAKSAAVNGALGLVLSPVPFAYGILKGKVGKSVAKSATEVNDQDVNAAMNQGAITPEEASWYKDFQAAQSKPADAQTHQDLSDRAASIIAKNNYPMPDKDSVSVNVLSDKDLHNLQGAISDQLISNVPDEMKSTLSDFMTHQSIGDFLDNDTAIDGLRGFSELMGKTIDEQTQNLHNDDVAMGDYLDRGISGQAELSQSHLFKALKENDFNDELLRSNNIHIPEAVKEKADLAKNNQSHAHITLKSAKEELQGIKQKLLPKNELIDDHASTDEFKRLQSLSSAWKPAKALLNRVNREDQLNAQKEFKQFADHIISAKDNGVRPIPDQTRAMNYLSTRIHNQMNRVREADNETAKKIAQMKTDFKLPRDVKSSLDEMENFVKNKGIDGLKKEFNEMKLKLESILDHPEALDNLINCCRGVAGV